jgi:TAT (twin-arginine translocation) pathway signal sequence
MVNRRDFLAGLVATPAAALMAKPPASLDSHEKVWVIIGVNWEYNDEVNAPAGDFVTAHVYTDKGLADEVCAELIRRFRETDDPDEYTGCDFAEPENWSDWSRDQKWDWLFGLTECPDRSPELDGGFGWVKLPFEVCALQLPASAVEQRALAAERLKEDRV